MSRYMTRLLPAGMLFVLLTTALATSAQRGQRSNVNVNLTGSWRDDRGRVSLVRQVDSDLCWYAESRPDSQEVFCGLIDRNMITGRWMDMPGSRQLTSGDLTLRIESDNRIVKVRSTSRYDASAWNREDSRAPRDSRDSRDPRDSRYSSINEGWELLAGSGRDIGVGSDGSVWLIGTEEGAGAGNAIFSRIREQWTRVDGAAVRIDVDGMGNPWVVNSSGEIYRRQRNQWQKLPGAATDIGAGAEGDVWIIGTNPVPGGFGIYRWTGRDWAPVDGGGVRIDVDGMGNPWIAKSDGSIYRRERNQWQKLPGTARDISVNGRGDAWIIGTDTAAGGFGIHHWTGREWLSVAGGATQLSVGGNGVVYVVNSSGQIFRRQ